MPSRTRTARKRRWRILPAFVLIAALTGVWFYAGQPAGPASAIVRTKSVPPAGEPGYVGAEACRDCHRNEVETWRGSHHALAMQEAAGETVLGHFDEVKFKHFGVESVFFKRDGKYWVRTGGPDGKPADYQIRYTFGVTPLQQYLIEFPGGRYQALGIAWDSRPKSEGGQRWFSLYPGEKMDAGDPLHWTGRYQNWNMQCAECHSTGLKKGYDRTTDMYRTTFSALNVSCEACHGPASRHVDWAGQGKAPAPNDDKGLVVKLESRWREAWRFPAPDARFAQRDRPAGDTLMNVCWACHARRSTLAEGGLPGRPLEETHRPALLMQPAYYADGQQREEDYTWGSFRQSRMYSKGVTCLDCHEPHALKLRAEGNALCTRCHQAAVFDTGRHHFHKAGSTGAQCLDCHAPKRNYMVIDGRHDHSFRLPRPDLSSRLGSPNACTECHQDRKPEWAAAALDRWYGSSWRKRPHYGTVLQAGVTEGTGAVPALLDLAQDPMIPAVVRATAAALAEPGLRPEFIDEARQLLQDIDPTVRVAALGLAERFEPAFRAQAASSLLSDPVRGVRIEAARILADVSDDLLSSALREARNKASREYREALALNADWPQENVNEGNFLLRQGRIDAATAAYRRALELDPLLIGAYVNFADLYRQQGRDDEGEKLLQKGLIRLSNAADLHHALGLLRVRQGRTASALRELRAASTLAPENPHYAYVYAVALHSSGKFREALAVLKKAEAKHPSDPDLLGALVAMLREAGEDESALGYARKAAEALPDDESMQRWVRELQGNK